MKKLSSQLGLFAVSTALCSLTLVATVNAATLQSRLGGLAYYDPDATLTWVADANLAQTSSYDADYWSSLYTDDPSRAWVTDMGSGTTYAPNKMMHEGFAWVVQSGDVNLIPVSSVPVPAAIWLFGSGLMGLIGFSRRKQQVI